MTTVRKYELTDERHPSATWLRRIRALVDIPRAGVRAGDLGGPAVTALLSLAAAVLVAVLGVLGASWGWLASGGLLWLGEQIGG